MKSHLKGIICIIIAGVGFSFMTFFVRLAGDLPTMQKAFFRNAFALIIAIATLLIKKEKFVLQKNCRFDIFMRCLFGTTGMIGNFYAIDRLNLADSNMLNKLSPFFAIILSIPILKEKPSKMDITATIIAFIGALFIIRPTGSNVQLVPALIGLYGGFGAGTAYVFVRRATGKGAKTPVIVICFSAFSCMLTLPFMIFQYKYMSPKQWLIMCMAGLSAAVGQFAITTAYKFAPAKRLSVFDYMQVVFAALWGIFFLGEIPVLLSVVGYVIIMSVAFVRWEVARRADVEEHAAAKSAN
ncbi:MAG TPA: EamA family transporter [Lachnospiraceae bacterium]|nr:EamA family transporter [Lachnospiraceae bacterium]